MSSPEDPTALVDPAGVSAYRSGSPPEAQALDFLVGEWSASSTRYAPDGRAWVSYSGVWRARWLHDRRILLDEFTARLGDGSELSYMATLRTFSRATGRFEMTFLIAHQPQRVRSFSGVFADGELRLEAEGTTHADQPMLARVRFHSITRSSFEWESTASLDAGSTWHRDCTISATRAR